MKEFITLPYVVVPTYHTVRYLLSEVDLLVLHSRCLYLFGKSNPGSFEKFKDTRETYGIRVPYMYELYFEWSYLQAMNSD